MRYILYLSISIIFLYVASFIHKMQFKVLKKTQHSTASYNNSNNNNNFLKVYNIII